MEVKFNECSLADACQRLSSGKNLSSKSIREKGEFPVFGGNGLRGYCDISNFSGCCAIIGRQGAQCGNVRYFEGKGYMTEHAIVAIASEDNNTRYLSYVLKSMNLGRLSGQSAQPGLAVGTLAKQIISLPPKAYQEKIVSIIAPLEDKIEINQKINDNLHQMAYETYMHLFFKKQANGSLVEIIEENPKSSVQVGEAKCASGDYPFFTSGDAILEWDEFMVDGRNCFLNTGGNAGVKFFIGKAAYSTDTWCITAKQNMADYLYLLLSSIEPELNQKFFQGTGLKHLQKPLLKDRMIYIPTEQEINDFNSKVQPAMDIISANSRENKNLSNLRDWLLPMLMNGQATVED